MQLENRIISLDGGDFTGKTTTITELKNYLNLERCPDPGYTEIGNKIRTMIKTTTIDNDVAKMLITAAEVAIFKSIKNEPKENKYFILDHFWVAGVVNQCIIPFCDRHNLDIFNFANWYPPVRKDLYIEILELMLTKIVSPQIEIPEYCFVLYATNPEILLARVDRDFEVPEQVGIDRLNEGYKLFCTVMLDEIRKYRALRGSTRYSIFAEVSNLIETVNPIIIDDKTATQIAEEILKILNEGN